MFWRNETKWSKHKLAQAQARIATLERIELLARDVVKNRAYALTDLRNEIARLDELTDTD